MDVDTDNFEQACALLQEHLPKAAFVALDLEMTGIMGPPDTKVSGGDAPQVQYTKGRAVVGRPYNIVQVGICLFEEKGPGQFECRPFNVYLFPRPFEERDNEGRQVKVEDTFMGLSASSAAFLVGNGMDLNRWVSKGVSYTCAATEEALLKALPPDNPTPAGDADGGRGFNGKEKVEPTKPADVALVAETLQKVAEFVGSEEVDMKLPGTNAFLALVLRQKIAELHPTLTVEKRPSATNPHWQDRWVVKLSDEGRKDRDAAKRRRLMGHIGFRQMWNLLKAHRRPAVFHNGFFDLLFLCTTLEGPLPHSLAEFKGLVHKAFPVLFDTKVLAEAQGLSGLLSPRSNLQELSEGLTALMSRESAAGPADPAQGAQQAETERSGAVAFSLAPGFEGYEAGSSTAFHTAGYDAFQTGRVFAYYRARLGDEQVLQFLNRVFLMFSAFELRLAEERDRFMFDGIVRHLYDVDTSFLHNRGLAELLKPIAEDGKRKLAFRWCDPRSLLLVVHGHADTAEDSAEREALERCLDGLLKAQEEQGRLRFRPLDEHLDGLAAAASSKDARKPPGPPEGSVAEPPAKRRRPG